MALEFEEVEGLDEFEEPTHIHTFEGEYGMLTPEDKKSFVLDINSYIKGMEDRNKLGNSSDNYHNMAESLYNLRDYLGRKGHYFTEKDLKHELNNTISQVSIYLAGKGINTYDGPIDLEGHAFKNDYEERRVKFAVKIYNELKERMASLEMIMPDPEKAELPKGYGKLKLHGDKSAFDAAVSDMMSKGRSVDDFKKNRFVMENYAALKREMEEVSKNQEFDEMFDEDKYQRLVQAYTNMMEAMDATKIEIPGLRDALEADMLLLQYADSTGEKKFDEAFPNITKEHIDAPLLNTPMAYDMDHELEDVDRLIDEGKRGVIGGTKYYDAIEEAVKDLHSAVRLYENGSKADAVKIKEGLENLKKVSQAYIDRKLAQPSLKDKELRRIEAARKAIAVADKRLAAMVPETFPAKNEAYQEYASDAKKDAKLDYATVMKASPKFIDREYVLGKMRPFTDKFTESKSLGKLVLLDTMGLKQTRKAADAGELGKFEVVEKPHSDQYYNNALKDMMVGALVTNGKPDTNAILSGKAFGKEFRGELVDIRNKMKKCTPEERQAMTRFAIETVVKHLSSAKNLSEQFVFGSKLLNDVLLRDEEGKKIENLPDDLAKTIKGINAVANIIKKGNASALMLNEYKVMDKTMISFGSEEAKTIQNEVANVVAMRAIEEKLKVFAGKPENANGVNPIFAKLASNDELHNLYESAKASDDFIFLKTMDVKNAVGVHLSDGNSVRKFCLEIGNKALGNENAKMPEEKEAKMFDGLSEALSAPVKEEGGRRL